MSTFHAVYASTSGNVEAVVEAVAAEFQQRHHSVILHRAEQTLLTVIQDNTHFIVATSTWEHGALNPFFVRLFKEMKGQDLSGKQAVFIGLGDTRYEPVLFCQGLETVRTQWLNQGAVQIGQTLKINGEPYGHLATVVKDWCQVVLNQFESGDGAKATASHHAHADHQPTSKVVK